MTGNAVRRMHFPANSILLIGLLLVGCAPAANTENQPGQREAEIATDATVSEPGEDAVLEEAGVAQGGIESGTWSQGAEMPTPRAEIGAVNVGGLIYTAGGFGGTTQFEAYDPASDMWLELASLPVGRNHASVAAVDSIVYVVGGGNGTSFEATRTLLAYDPESDSWERRANMPQARFASAAVELVHVQGTKVE